MVSGERQDGAEVCGDLPGGEAEQADLRPRLRQPRDVHAQEGSKQCLQKL